MAEIRRIYIDSCCFIDMVQVAVGKTVASDKEKDVWHLKRLLEAVRDKEIAAFTSTLTIAECQHVGDGKVTEGVKSQFSRLLMSGQYVNLVQATPFIAQDARDLRWIKGISLRGADGLHVASALAMKCEEFLSSDNRIGRINAVAKVLVKDSLRVCRGKDTQCLPDKYRQLNLDENSKP